jgi:hypothetical protein
VYNRGAYRHPPRQADFDALRVIDIRYCNIQATAWKKDALCEDLRRLDLRLARQQASDQCD